MIYTLDIPLLIRRNVPQWFRWPVNLAFARVLATWVGRIHDDFLAWRTGTVLPEYRYNGLIHSLEWALNDRFDPVQRRIYITVVDQVPVFYHVTPGQPPYVAYSAPGTLTGYAHITPGQAAPVYLYEFLVWVPAVISFSAVEMFQLLDLYRYAGRRPAIRRFTGVDTEVETILYYGLEPAANHQPGTLPELPQLQGG